MPPKVRRKIFKPEEDEVVETAPVKTRRKERPVVEDEDDAPSSTSKYEDVGSPRTLLANGVPCVYVEKGVTKNMGEYNSARVTIGMMLPIDYTTEDLKNAEKAISVIDKIIVKRLEAEVDELLE